LNESNRVFRTLLHPLFMFAEQNVDPLSHVIV